MAFTAYTWQTFKDFTKGTSSSIHPDTESGYDIQGGKLTDKRIELALEQANGVLSGLGGFRVRFFCTELAIDIGLAGSYGQGRRVRDFYAHNIQMPTFKITGQLLSQNEYGHLVEFVHESHQAALVRGEPVQFDLLEGGMKLKRAITRGDHKAVSVQGFVETIAREHKRFVYAPTFSFNMAVTHSYHGIFQGISANDASQQTFIQILEEQEKTAFSQAPKKTTAKGSQPKATPGPLGLPTGEQLHEAGF